MGHGNLCILRVLLTLALSLGARPALADDWPSKPVTIVVPYAAGGNTDFIARLTADRLRRAFGVTFVVDNRTGASGTIAAEYVARQTGDQHTLFLGTISQISIAPFIQKLRYDPVRDFVPIANVGGNPYVLTVAASQPFRNLAELVAFAKAAPGKLTVGHAGVGSMTHLSASLFLRRAEISATMVPYKGGGPALNDLIAGQIDLYSGNVSEIVPHVNGGRLRFLGVSSEKPIKLLANVPVLAATYPGLSAETWNGLLGPAGMSAAVVDRLSSEVAKIVSSAEFQARLEEAGVTPQVGEVKDAFAQRIQRDMAYWKRVLEQSGIKLD